MKTFLKKAKRGFTITELVIVVVVIAVLMVILLPTLMDSVNEDKQDTAISQGRNEWTFYSASADLPEIGEQNYLSEVTVDGTTIYFWIIAGTFVEIPQSEKPESINVTLDGDSAPTALSVTDTQVNTGNGYQPAYDNVKIYALSQE